MTGPEVEEALERLRSANNMKTEHEVERIAEFATQAFFAVVAAALPEGTADGGAPDAHMAWEHAAQSAVRTMMANIE